MIAIGYHTKRSDPPTFYLRAFSNSLAIQNRNTLSHFQRSGLATLPPNTCGFQGFSAAFIGIHHRDKKKEYYCRKHCGDYYSHHIPINAYQYVELKITWRLEVCHENVSYKWCDCIGVSGCRDRKKRSLLRPA